MGLQRCVASIAEFSVHPLVKTVDFGLSAPSLADPCQRCLGRANPVQSLLTDLALVQVAHQPLAAVALELVIGECPDTRA